MDSPVLLELLAILTLILANGYFALSEFSVIASRKSKLKQNVDEKKPGALAAKKLHDNPNKFLASVQVGITLFGTLAGVYGGATLVKELETAILALQIDWLSQFVSPLSVALVALLITVVSVTLGELVPKYIALSNPERFAIMVARPISIFVKISGFFAISLSSLSNFIIKMIGIKEDSTRSAISEDEINLMILEGKEKGVFDDTEEKLIKSVFDFADSTVRRAMTPRTDVVGLEINENQKKITSIIIENEYSRYPVYRKTIDNIVGVLHTKDLIVQNIDPNLIILNDIIRKTMFVPDSMPLSKLLNEFQMKKIHLAIVLDEFGGTAGIITLEDLLEELVGEIRDEYDEESPPLVKQSDNVAFAEGSVWPGAVNELIGCNLPEAGVDSLAGLIIDKLGKIPKKNDIIEIENVKISILEMDQNRMTRLKLEKIDEPSE